MKGRKWYSLKKDLPFITGMFDELDELTV